MYTNRRITQRKPRKQRDLIERSRFTNVNDTMVMNFTRVTQLTRISLNDVTGFVIGAVASPDLALSFSLGDTYLYLAGVLASTVANPGATDISNLFEQFRIQNVELQFFYSYNTAMSANYVGETPANTALALPVLNFAYDPNDTNDTDLTAILQYNNMRSIQLGNNRTSDGFILKFAPVPQISANTVPATSQPVAQVRAWINTDYPTTNHYGLKVVLDPITTGTSTGDIIGYLQIYARYHILARRPK